jgi:hypothetical protein
MTGFPNRSFLFILAAAVSALPLLFLIAQN